jgi:hypothetical protein
MGKILFPKYFPSCPSEPENPVINGSLTAIMALYWRVRTIQFTCVLGEAGTQVLTYRSQATEEKDLVCQNIFGQASPNPFVISGVTFEYAIFTPGTQARISINLEKPSSELFIGGNEAFTDSTSFSIGSTELGASIKWSGTDNEESPQHNAYLTSVGCTEFWSYGKTYNTSNGSLL